MWWFEGFVDCSGSKHTSAAIYRRNPECIKLYARLADCGRKHLKILEAIGTSSTSSLGKMPRVATLLCFASTLLVPVLHCTVSSVEAAGSQVRACIHMMQELATTTAVWRHTATCAGNCYVCHIVFNGEPVPLIAGILHAPAFS